MVFSLGLLGKLRHFFDLGGERYSNNGPVLLKNGEGLIMGSGCLNKTCEGSYEEGDRRDELGNKIEGYIITYNFEYNPDSFNKLIIFVCAS